MLVWAYLGKINSHVSCETEEVLLVGDINKSTGISGIMSSWPLLSHYTTVFKLSFKVALKLWVIGAQAFFQSLIQSNLAIRGLRIRFWFKKDGLEIYQSHVILRKVTFAKIHTQQHRKLTSLESFLWLALRAKMSTPYIWSCLLAQVILTGYRTEID